MSPVFEGPMKTFAIAQLAEVVTMMSATALPSFQSYNHSPKRIRTEEADKRVQLADTVLQRRTGKTPLVFGIESESSFSRVGRSFLDIVCFIENNSEM